MLKWVKWVINRSFVNKLKMNITKMLQKGDRWFSSRQLDRQTQTFGFGTRPQIPEINMPLDIKVHNLAKLVTTLCKDQDKPDNIGHHS